MISLDGTEGGAEEEGAREGRPEGGRRRGGREEAETLKGKEDDRSDGDAKAELGMIVGSSRAVRRGETMGDKEAAGGATETAEEAA